jgi:tetratricopeptide (TPR) repeat protein
MNVAIGRILLRIFGSNLTRTDRHTIFRYQFSLASQGGWTMSEIPMGVYMEVIEHHLGTGSTARRHQTQNYYLAGAIDADTIKVQLLDMNDQPMKISQTVPLTEFMKRFTYQPDYLENKKSPQEQHIDRAIAQAEAHYRRKEYFSAEFEYGKVLKIDEENVRANFGVGKVYMAMGDLTKAEETFRKLTRIDAVFEEKNKHIFNELGMELRRLKLYDQAVAYYVKALSFTKDDENLYFNLGRALFEKGDLKRAGAALKKSLALNPGMNEARILLGTIKKSTT